MVKSAMRYFLCILPLCLVDLAHASQHTYIKLNLDSREVYVGDTVVLEVESTGLHDPIDYSLVEAESELIRETSGSHIAVINGKVAEIAIRRLVIVPKRTGVLVIGPLAAGDVLSNSVHLKVLDTERPDWQPQASDLQINTSLSPRSLMVNQKGVLTVELLHRYPISNESVALPDLNGFSRRALLENRRTLKGDDRDWYSTLWQYLIFPKQSGSIRIEGISWSGTTAKSRTEKSDFNRQSQPLTVTIGSPATHPTISDAAKNMDWWLPATSLQLTEEWSQSPTELRAGDELHRTIHVEAGSVLSGQIPTPVVPQGRAIQQTLINTQRQETITADTVVSKATFTYRVKAQSPIPVFLDTVRLPWWNTVNNTVEEAIIPARRINVGLPDRADVLSQLAIQETGVNRFRHWLQSTGWFRVFTGVVGVVSGIYILLNLLPVITSHFRVQTLTKQQASRLQLLADQGDFESLYRELHHDKSGLLMYRSREKLLRALEERLFCDSSIVDAPDISATQINSLLQDVLQQTAGQSVFVWLSRNNASENSNLTVEKTLAKL